MKYIVDHDYHIHSKLSTCSSDPLQTPDRMLRYAKEHGLKRICIADHFWDDAVEGASDWYAPQDYAHISESLPLPQDADVEFLFACETELDKNLTLGLSPEKYDKFDFIIIPTTHLHMKNFTVEADATLEMRADAYVKRFEKILSMDLPFHKVGIAHLTCPLIAKKPPEAFIEVLDMVSDETFERLFTKAAALGVGIELNFQTNYEEEAMERILRVYRIAKKCGCKFYLGSDTHKECYLDGGYNRLCRIVDMLELEESDKFILNINR